MRSLGQSGPFKWLAKSFFFCSVLLTVAIPAFAQSLGTVEVQTGLPLEITLTWTPTPDGFLLPSERLSMELIVIEPDGSFVGRSPCLAPVPSLTSPSGGLFISPAIQGYSRSPEQYSHPDPPAGKYTVLIEPCATYRADHLSALPDFTAAVTVSSGAELITTFDSLSFPRPYVCCESFVVEANTQTRLAAPTNLGATQIGTTGNMIQLTWNYESDAVDGFKIERKTPSSSWTELSTISGVGTHSYTDTNVSPFATYSYRLVAYRGPEVSSYSNVATCFQIQALAHGPQVSAFFSPEFGHSVQEIAQLFGYDHMNWISIINHDPDCFKNNPMLHDFDRNPALSPHLDPPLGGYLEYFFGDNLPYYWNEGQLWYRNPIFRLDPDYDIFSANAGGDQRVSKTLNFSDIPMLPCLPGSNPSTGSSEYWGFFTSLVGIKTPTGADPVSNPPNFTPLASFSWYTTYNGAAGGAAAGRPINLTQPAIPGTGGVFNVKVVRPEELPLDVRSLLIRLGAGGVSAAPRIDTNAPTTTAFLSGQQGTNGWFKGPVTVTLISTDIDGPANVASTVYRLDAGAATEYTSSFTLFGDGLHTLQFFSVDSFGNVETPEVNQTVQIDTTPPTISCMASPNMLWPPNGRTVSVSISGTITDTISGVDSSTSIFVVTDSEGKAQLSGELKFGVGGTYSFTVPLVASRNSHNKDGRVYEITLHSRDKAGNLASFSIPIKVPHDQGLRLSLESAP